MELKELVPEELDSLYLRTLVSPSKSDDAGVRILQGIVDPVHRSEETTVALVALFDEMEDRARRRTGKLDDALVIVLRGALNC